MESHNGTRQSTPKRISFATMSEREKLVSEIRGFLAKTGMFPTKLSLEVSTERGLVARILAGGDCTLSTADKLRRAMREHVKKKPSRVVDRLSA